MKFYIPAGGSAVTTVKIKKKNIKKLLEGYNNKDRLKEFIFAVERQIDSSTCIGENMNLLPGAFGRKGMTEKKAIKLDETIIERNRKFLKFIKDKYQVELTDKDRELLWYKELKERNIYL